MALLELDDEQQVETDLVIFDKDGTLISHDHYIPIMQARARIIAQSLDLSQEVERGLLEMLGVDPQRKAIIPQGNIYTPRRDVFRQVVQFLGIEGIKSKVAGEATRMGFKDADTEVQLEKHVKPIHGTLELLQALHQAGVKTAVCTHDTSRAAKKHLKAANLYEFITCVLGLDPGSKLRAKPAPDMINSICKQFKTPTTKALFVGDTDMDMQAGKAAGVALCIGVLSGQSTAEEFFSADLVIESVIGMKVL